MLFALLRRMCPHARIVLFALLRRMYPHARMLKYESFPFPRPPPRLGGYLLAAARELFLFFVFPSDLHHGKLSHVAADVLHSSDRR